MVDNFENKMADYAKLLANFAINVQPGQKIVLQSNVTQYENTKFVIDALYEAGAGDVIMD